MYSSYTEASERQISVLGAITVPEQEVDGKGRLRYLACLGA